jgi:hypothetical protein
MLEQFKRDADGGITLVIQNESPDKDKEANWLPAPKGPFNMIMRLYLPKPEALNKSFAGGTQGFETPSSPPCRWTSGRAGIWT